MSYDRGVPPPMTKCVVLLGRSFLMPAIRERLEKATDVMLFEVHETMPSTEHLASHLPPLIVLSHSIAWSSAGLEFIEQFRALSPETDFRVLPETEQAASKVIHGSADSQAVPGLMAATFPLPRVPARRYTRRAMPNGTTAVVNGETATLVNLSPLGAQVLTRAVLKPAQQVSFSISGNPRSRVRGVVAWSHYELSGGGGSPHFRAGVAFSNRLPDTSAGEERAR